MDTRIQNIQSALSALRTANDAAARLTKPIQAAEAEGHGFGVALESALRPVSAAQNNSSHLQRQVQMENPSFSLEGPMVAMQKAQVGFQATHQVRNRLVHASPGGMKMQV